MFIITTGSELTREQLENFITFHQTEVASRYKKLYDFYKSDHPILHQASKESYKPDNRIVVNFAKYIVDTLNGYFIGIPVKIMHEEETINDYLSFLSAYNDLDDKNAERSKLTSIYGHAYELLYMDEDANVGITNLSPEEAFLIYDDSLLHRPVYGVRYYTNQNGDLEGSYSDDKAIYYFNSEFNITEIVEHPFSTVPIIEYLENDERLGAFEPVITQINAYNKAISEKANDVDYYADSYMVIKGQELDETTIQRLRDNRIINAYGEDAKDIDIYFLSKPEADQTQENLINRLEREIFQISMVPNINDENFGQASGIALSYKLQSLSNLAEIKKRKFTAGLNKRYKAISNVPTIPLKDYDWAKIRYTYTANQPKNILEEAQVAGMLAGVTSDETQLSVLSIVDNVKEELRRKKAEEESELTSRLEEAPVESEDIKDL